MMMVMMMVMMMIRSGGIIFHSIPNR
jgi:hypothetical protein